ncbi:MAG: sugar phosphate isomerase/epimerase, partial [Rhizobiales bacterium]|nr:sugar phosphate isomerase/epimerase [Hyphomicrobiales bacterium]
VEKSFNAQLADTKTLPIETITMLTDRLFPGDGCARVGEVIRTLVRRGYSGWWTVELFNPDFQTMMPNQVARQAYQSAAGLLAAIESNNAQPFDS